MFETEEVYDREFVYRLINNQHPLVAFSHLVRLHQILDTHLEIVQLELDYELADIEESERVKAGGSTKSESILRRLKEAKARQIKLNSFEHKRTLDLVGNLIDCFEDSLTTIGGDISKLLDQAESDPFIAKQLAHKISTEQETVVKKEIVNNLKQRDLYIPEETVNAITNENTSGSDSRA